MGGQHLTRAAVAVAALVALLATGLAPSPAAAQAPAHRFPDVPLGVYFDAPVRWMQGEGLTDGYGNSGLFRPALPVSRAEAATLLWRHEGRPTPADPVPPFPDAQAPSYFRTAVAWMYEEGITRGVGDTGMFQPERTVTRGELATLLHRLEGSPAVGAPRPFPDVVPGSYYDRPVHWMAAAGLTDGYGDTGRFQASRTLSRGELATFLWRYAGRPPAPDLPPPPARQSVFTGTRMVALYGRPGSNALGALGEQGLDATVARARSVAAPYDADGRRVVPTFEIIASLATAGPGPDGDYSAITPVDELRPWVDRAADEGFYVILDLQTGRSDFLTHARAYEPLLLEPHVGLALDPEWRLEPGETHAGHIGSVSAAEVNSVLDWLSDLVRDNGLPNKPVILHQFRHDMLPDRHLIATPPGLDVVIHMDGLGSQAQKDQTYAQITAGAEWSWHWGWKNFYDEDVPLAPPSKVLGLDPRPVFVSYQ